MNLESLGWDEHFQAQVEGMDTSRYVVGRVFRSDSGDHVSVLTEQGEISARIPGRLKDPRKHDISELPCIGDWVLVKPDELVNEMVAVLARKNHISRKVAGEGSKEQMVGANIDHIFIVMGLDNDYNLRRLERFLFMVHAARAHPVVLLNKADIPGLDLNRLLSDVDEISSGAPVHCISALEEDGLDSVRQYLGEGVTISMVGSSGVGKSTLINALLGEEKQDTKSVREKDSHGRHVTSSRELFILSQGGVVIDNPGIRELQLWGDSEDLQSVFADIDELAHGCRFKDCTHVSEPKCAVKAALDDGNLSQKRYDNYIKMKKELDYLQQRADLGSRGAEKAKWKGIAKITKEYKSTKERR